MFSRNQLMASLAISLLSIASFANALAPALNEKQSTHLNARNVHFTIKGGNVVLKSLIRDINIPEQVKEELKKEQAIEAKPKNSGRFARDLWSPRSSIGRNINPFAYPDFFECNDQAQIVLSAYTENHRYWEAFFKRNSINDTLAVRYCCNLLEYVDNAEMSLTPECRDQVRLQDHVMSKPEIRYVCRQYEFYNVQCFLVRWMYWWIPFILLVLIGVGIFFGCAALKRRRNKSQLHEDVKSLKEAKTPTYDDHNSNTLPYRPAYTSPLKPVTNKAFMHH